MRRHWMLIAAVGAFLVLGAASVALATHPALQDDPVLPESLVIEGVDVGGLPLSQALARLEAVRTRQGRLQVPELGLSLEVTLIGSLEDVAGRLSDLTRGSYADRLRRWYALAEEGSLDVAYAVPDQQRALVQQQVEAALPRPEPGRLVFTDQAVQVVPDRPGLAAREGAWAEAWRALAQGAGAVRLPLEPVRGEPSTEDLQAMRLEKLVVTFSTRFDAGQEGRAANIALAAAAVDGTMVAPGQVFSFNATVGPRSAARGYREAPVIEEGELVPGIGGGVCQVSSTLHVAFLMAGLERVAARNHSIPIAYLPMGWDAAVAWDFLDLQYRNNSQGHIYIRMDVPRPGELRVSLYGPADITPREIKTRLVETRPPETRVVQDGQLAPGETRVLSPGRPTYVVDTYTVGPDGQWVFSHRSSYRGEARVVATGSQVTQESR